MCGYLVYAGSRDGQKPWPEFESFIWIILHGDILLLCSSIPKYQAPIYKVVKKPFLIRL